MSDRKLGGEEMFYSHQTLTDVSILFGIVNWKMELFVKNLIFRGVCRSFAAIKQLVEVAKTKVQ